MQTPPRGIKRPATMFNTYDTTVMNKRNTMFNDYDPLEMNKKRTKTRRHAPPSNNRFKGVNEYGIPIPSTNSQNYEPGINENVMLFDPSTGVNIYKKARNKKII